MRYTPRIYAHALAEAAAQAKGREAIHAVVKNFLALLDRTGDRATLRAVLPEAERLLLRKTGGEKMIIESARPLSEHARTHVRASMPHAVAAEERITPELLAGVRITVNDERQLDGSLAHALHQLFRT